MLPLVTVFSLCLFGAARAFPGAPDVRVVNGETATLGQFPYQALVEVNLAEGRALCGGSLLSDEWVLTAGHCVEKAKFFNVHLGAVNFQDTDNDGRLVLRADTYFRHEKYNPLFAANDVAVIKLPQKVQFSDRVQPVRLPDGKDDYTGREVLVSGWGLQKNGGTVAQQLQYAPLTVISNAQCTKTYNPLVIKKTTLCARGEDKQSPCNGDSGGPLVLADGEDHKVLVGVVSFGHAFGCERGFPGAFARVTAFREWIGKKTGL